MKITKILLVALFAMFSTTLSAQEGTTRTAWSAEVENLGEGYYNINVTAKVPEGLHIYSLGVYCKVYIFSSVSKVNLPIRFLFV